jgi:hypothetical protein
MKSSLPVFSMGSVSVAAPGKPVKGR